MKTLTSRVAGSEGECLPVRLNGSGKTGFFRLSKRVSWWPFPVRYGDEFHGVIRGGVVESIYQKQVAS